MGRRKERRLAAKASSGRRVKLDLFLDASPGETPFREGVRGEIRDQQTGLPTSPSSSDKKENPLALLGQYSDDEEEDEEAADQQNDESKGSPTDAGAKIATRKHSCTIMPNSCSTPSPIHSFSLIFLTEMTVVIKEFELTWRHGDHVCLFQGNHEYSDLAGAKGDHTDSAAAASSGQQVLNQADDDKNCTGNVAEKNTVAPEPTLENESAPATEAIPDASGMQIVGDVGGNWKAVMHEQSNQCYYWNTVTGETSWEMPNGLTSESAADGAISASVPAHVDYAVEAQAHALTQNSVEAYPSDVSVMNGTVAYASLGTECGTGQPTHDAYAYAYTGAVASHESMDIDPLQLARYGEDLLQRLKLLERLHGSFDTHELIKKEIEIRIADCNALSSYGSSLLPLWLHAEVHLKQLEYSISKLEASHSTTEPGHVETEGVEYKAPNEAEVVSSNCKNLKFEVSTGVTMDENVKIEEPSSTSSVQNSQEKDAAAVLSKVESDSDEDMDVEMEVDDENIEGLEQSSSMPSKEHPPSEQVHSPTMLSLEGSAVPPDDNDVPPPPPEDEWIPPPPPDNEPAPPPPPDEPVVSYVCTETIPQPYIGEANLGYTLPGVEYYAATGTEGTNASYYMQLSEPHVLQAQQNAYYASASASSVYVPVDATSNVPEPVSYYSYPSVTMAATVEAAAPSGYYDSSVSAISSSVLNNNTSSADLAPANSSLNPMESDKVISKEAKIASLSQAAALAPGTTSVLGSSTQASTSTTNQTKVIRSKKRAVAAASSLRSNKKVSSMVDKWKAAKEELRDEDDEEPDDALEALEWKRQKEINEWRKQQIASGEAQENANFVPLRGDWRDRVKRRRAEAKSKAESVTSPVSASKAHTGQPDVAELSKGLPPGWQAYMDESTKQVYYGNSLTSDTTWIRPTK